MRKITKDELKERIGDGEIVLWTNDSTYYFFNETGYKISNDSLFGTGFVKYNEDSDFEEFFEGTIALKNIEMIEQDELNPVTTTILIVGGILLVVGVGLFIAFVEAVSE
jgi:hypothetical protein